MTDFNKRDKQDVKEKTRTYVDVGRREQEREWYHREGMGYKVTQERSKRSWDVELQLRWDKGLDGESVQSSNKMKENLKTILRLKKVELNYTVLSPQASCPDAT